MFRKYSSVITVVVSILFAFSTIALAQSAEEMAKQQSLGVKYVHRYEGSTFTCTIIGDNMTYNQNGMRCDAGKIVNKRVVDNKLLFELQGGCKAGAKFSLYGDTLTEHTPNIGNIYYSLER